MNFSQKRLKDVSVSDTLRNLDDILYTDREGINIDFDLSEIEADYGKSYNITGSINGIPVVANGKGVDSLYAMASLKAEFVERLNTLNWAFINCTNKYCAELFVSGEYNVNYDRDFGNLSDGIVKNVHNFFDFICGTEISRIPVKAHNLVDGSIVNSSGYQLFFGSNGLCSGNTQDEALLQGLFELIERHNEYLFMRGMLKAIKISDDIVRANMSDEIIERVDSMSKYGKVEFYSVNFSDEIGETVMCMFYRFDDKYSFNFASSPFLSTAIERTVTGITQGSCNIGEMPSCEYDFRSYNSGYSMAYSIDNALKYGTGNLSERAFLNMVSNEKPNFCKINWDGKDCTEILRDVSTRLDGLGHYVHYIDMSWLGFKSYSLISSLKEVNYFCSSGLAIVTEGLKLMDKVFKSNKISDIKELLLEVRKIKEQCDSTPHVWSLGYSIDPEFYTIMESYSRANVENKNLNCVRAYKHFLDAVDNPQIASKLREVYLGVPEFGDDELTEVAIQLKHIISKSLRVATKPIPDAIKILVKKHLNSIYGG